MGARETALSALIACRKEGAWSNGVLKEYIRRDGLDRRDAALAARLCYGVLQNRMKLDFYLKQLLTGRLKDLQPIVRDILHLGLYQLFMMDKIPQSAAVNESVSLAKRYCRNQRNASGLVNGVLRNAVRRQNDLNEPTTLADRYSHPQKLIALLSGYVGKERLEPMLAANNAVPDTVIQINTLRTTADGLTQSLAQCGIVVRKHPWLPDSLVISGTGDLEQLDAFKNGLFYVQDAAAKLSVLCAGITAPCNVLDCCAAPGGKSFATAITMQGKGSIISCDVHQHKTELIRKGAERLGLTNIREQLHDATVDNALWHQNFDVVIADVPCSGYGIIRKKPDIRYKDPDTMKALPALQLKILQKQADHVRPGGVLMYSTCTLVREENEGVVENFLNSNPDFSIEPLPLVAPFPANTTGMLTLVPGEYDTDGFFICRLRRKL